MALSDLQALLDSYPERWLAAAIAGVELRLNDADAIETINAQQREKAERREVRRRSPGRTVVAPRPTGSSQPVTTDSRGALLAARLPGRVGFGQSADRRMPSDNDRPMRRRGNTGLTAPLVASVAAAMLLLAGAPAVADNINGTSGRDRLFGTAGSDEIRGLRGSDYMVGRPGSDVLYGGPGGDWVNDGLGDDRVLLGSGADFVSLQRGGDDVHAGAGDDSIQVRVDGRRDRIYCGGGRNDIARYIYRLDPRDQYFDCETIEEYSP